MFTLRPEGCFPVIVVSGCGLLPPFPSLAAAVFHPANWQTIPNSEDFCGRAKNLSAAAAER